MSFIEVKTFTGADAIPWVEPVTDLRVAVLRDWPYLYAGDRANVARRVATYAQSPQGLFVLAFDDARLVGASTAMPLSGEMYALQQPFRNRHIAVDEVFYFGESVLLKEYRGFGLGHRFFDERERHARRLGKYKLSAFCAIERALDDPRRPHLHRSSNPFWMRRGYNRQDDMFSELDWPVVGSDQPERHRLRVWLRAIDAQ